MPRWGTTARSNCGARSCGMIAHRRQVVTTVDSVMPCARLKAWFRAGGDDRPGDASALPFRRLLPHAPLAPAALRPPVPMREGDRPMAPHPFRPAPPPPLAPPRLPPLNLHAAGIDIGATSHFVAVPPGRDTPSVREFATFTAD